MVNAAKFGGGSPVDVYAEALDGELQVFVRDRGPGFEPGRPCPPTAAACASRSSGGWSATAGAPRSTPRPAGTEVELALPRSAA